MELAVPAKTSTRISKRSIEKSPPAETAKTEKPKGEEKLEQVLAQNNTQEASLNKNESTTEMPNSSGNSTDNQPKGEEKNENLPKPELTTGTPNSPPNSTYDPHKAEGLKENLPKTELETELPNLSQNTTLAPTAPGNPNITTMENRGLGINQTKTDGISLTGSDGKNYTIAKANEQGPDNEGVIDVPKNPAPLLNGDENADFEATPVAQDNDIREIGNPFDQTRFSSSSRVSDHVYYPLLHVFLTLFLVIYLYPQAKSFFNWIQKIFTNTEMKTRRKKKQHN